MIRDHSESAREVKPGRGIREEIRGIVNDTPYLPDQDERTEQNTPEVAIRPFLSNYTV